MAAPTPVTATQWDGHRGLVRWYAAWADGTQLTDSSIVDISGLSPAPDSVKIRAIDIVINGNVDVALEFDATTDQLIDRFIGQTDVTFQFQRDYSDGPSDGFIGSTGAAGFTGDIFLTTTGAASGDEINLMIIFEKS